MTGQAPGRSGVVYVANCRSVCFDPDAESNSNESRVCVQQRGGRDEMVGLHVRARDNVQLSMKCEGSDPLTKLDEV